MKHPNDEHQPKFSRVRKSGILEQRTNFTAHIYGMTNRLTFKHEVQEPIMCHCIAIVGVRLGVIVNFASHFCHPNISD